ncbi:MAG TPA: sigma-54 dependent transcriptional regulator [Methylococcaceae bacterium]|nr:sigma-54 dependent transcriptional regulator [Methylococcaceae bacterium]
MTQNPPLALVVDDEADIRELIELTLSRMNIATRAAATLEEARRLIARDAFDLCLTDMRLPDGDGLDWVEYMQRHHPAVPVAVITAHGSMETAVRAMKSGAFDFASKPLDLHKLRNLVNAALQLNRRGTKPQGRQSLLGASPALEEIRAKIAKLARSQAPIFVGGESGTGKELVARLIHTQGPRADRPFVPVNCGAIPPDLMESEFFGHKKGSFTGATSDKTGLFQAAEGGTLFLDEVADLPLALQVKLLRAIQEKAIRPVGEQREIPVDVRLLSASHRNLEQLVREGLFRQDLFYRINVIALYMPPLRERREDIAPLAGAILERLAATQGVPPPALVPETLAALGAYSFPGNVRELENILERALALCEGDTLAVADLDLPRHGGTAAAPGAEEDETDFQPGEPPPADLPALANYMDELERQAILKVLEQVRWNRTAAARQLGITFRSLRYRLKKLGLD